MVSKIPNPDLHLIPERHPQPDLFVCDVADAILKDVMDHMEHPFYSLSKKPETHVRRYEHNGNWLEVVPSVKGLATIYDKDILIYCISQIMAKLNRGEKVSRRVQINSRALLEFTNRGTAGKDYKALTEALSRLAGTQISTNIRIGDEEEFRTFHLIEEGTVRRKHGLDGRLLSCEVAISDWVFDAIRNKAVLTLHRNYFRLRKPIERRVYELARKQCGQQESSSIGLALLHKKSGSRSTLKEFRRAIRDLTRNDHLPDYKVEYRAGDDMVIFTNRNTMPKDHSSQVPKPFASEDAMIEAVEISGGWDKYILEEAWQTFCQKNDIRPRDPDKHFLKFCQTYRENHGAADARLI